MKLPNAGLALIPAEKLRDYLLSSTHPVGRFKAVFFRSLGYTSGHWQSLEADIRSLLENDVEFGEQTDFGQKFEVKGRIIGPAGKTASIVTVWIVLKGENVPRFVTAFPGDGK
jgi:hypothetical protein